MGYVIFPWVDMILLLDFVFLLRDVLQIEMFEMFTLLKTNMAPENVPPFVRGKSSSQPSFFGGHVSFRECTLSPIIMEVENHPKGKGTHIEKDPFSSIFHFHDYGRKGKVIFYGFYHGIHHH